MSHAVKDKDKIVSRLNRIQGQLNAAFNAVKNEEEAYTLLQLLSSTRGALSGLMGDIIEHHIIEHIVKASSKKEAALAGKEVNEILKSFWK